MSDPTPMTIVRLEAENVKRLKAVQITPDGELVVIGGANGAGKSSVLDSILYALGGASTLPPLPVRKGERVGMIEVDLGELVVSRKIKPDGKTQLVVTSPEGAKQKKPQAILDALVGHLSFDPLAFTKLDPRKRLEQLRELVGLDFSEIDEERAKAYQERTIHNRTIKRLEAQVGRRRPDPSLPAEPVDVEDLERRHAAARAAQRKVSDLELQLHSLQRAADRAREALEAAEGALAEGQAALAEAVMSDHENPAELEAQLDAVASTNRKIAENQALARQLEEVREESAYADALTHRIQEIDAEKKRRVAEARFPVPGLALDDEGVTLDGVPFDQASSAQQLVASVAMGLALNPRLRVLLIRDGSLLDQEHLATIARMAAEAQAQLWIERVGEGAECSVIIEDGEVRP